MLTWIKLIGITVKPVEFGDGPAVTYAGEYRATASNAPKLIARSRMTNFGLFLTCISFPSLLSLDAFLINHSDILAHRIGEEEKKG